MATSSGYIFDCNVLCLLAPAYIPIRCLFNNVCIRWNDMLTGGLDWSYRPSTCVNARWQLSGSKTITICTVCVRSIPRVGQLSCGQCVQYKNHKLNYA